MGRSSTDTAGASSAAERGATTPELGRYTGADGNRAIFLPTLAGVARALRTKRVELRYQLVHEVWSATKLFGARAVTNVDARDLPVLRDAVVTGYLDDRNRAVLAALCRGIEARTFFEIGTNRGRTAWTIAHNNPQLQVYTLDLPSAESDVALPLDEADLTFLAGWASGEAFLGTPEAGRITALVGDSATFDFAPYRGTIDVVYVDGAHSYEYVRNDTQAALELLTPNGVIAWDDYPAISGVYRALNEIAPTLQGSLFHILGTRLAVYSERELVLRTESARRGVYNVA